ncbi:MAG TPA: pilus assembly protein TadG-related protein [Candidatus Dormibacteraeota bacterium]|nr:pilus assembly protein TadG-related protein [Candidatus Dormibacteraeota bacterium]
MSSASRTRRQRGQVAVVFALAAVAIIAVVGLAIDAGRDFVDQRALQAATDTAAQSGASMLADDFHACISSGFVPYADSQIAAAVSKIALAAGAAQGKATGTPSADFVSYPKGGVPTSLGPVSSYAQPYCVASSWTGPAGLQVTAQDAHSTLILPIVGIDNAVERATSIALFGTVAGGAGAPFAAWDAFCYTGSGGPLAVGDQVVLLDPSWDKYTCGYGPPASFKGYLDPIAPVTLPIADGACIQTGPGVGLKTPPALAVGKTYLIPIISAYGKGYCPGYSAANAGPYKLTYSGVAAVSIVSASQVQIIGKVTSTSPTVQDLTICPAGDPTCAPATKTTPTSVELYR